ncbi:MAG: hypothetical protein ACRDYU_10170 [Actinomycetes bacterium]
MTSRAETSRAETSSPSETVPATGGETPDGGAALEAIEHCYAQGWTDGLPVAPCTPDLLARFLDTVDRDPDDVVLDMPQLNRRCTVRLAAINAAMAGCLPEYFPVVLAAWDSVAAEGYAGRGIWQSTTGCGTLLLVNGPVRDRIGLNSRNNVLGAGFRANATIGRAIRLAVVTVFGLRPGELDQATQGTPAKYTCCIAENEDESPWPPLHADHGHGRQESTVTAMTMRSTAHVEARHTVVGEQLLHDLADTVSRTGALLHERLSACLLLGPEHAHMLADQGWTKRGVSEFVYEHAVRTRAALDRVGKGSVSGRTRWRVPHDHPDAVRDDGTGAGPDAVRVVGSPDAVLVAVAGAGNSGVSSVVETFGPRGGSPAMTRVEERS